MKANKLFAVVLTLCMTITVFLTGAQEANAHGLGYSTSTHCLPAVLKTRLNQIRQKFGSVLIISTFRKGARVRGSGRKSLHASCRAVDFKVKNSAAVFKWLKANHNGGVGIYYGKCTHIHIDNGDRYHWVRKGC